MGIQIQMQFDKDFGPIVNFLHEFVPKLNIEEGNKKYQTSILLHGPQTKKSTHHFD